MTPRERNLSDIGLIALRHGLTRHDVLNHYGKRCDRKAAARRDVALHFRAKDYSWPKIGRIVSRDHSTVMAWAGAI
jgi:chromosomal replication initiation ATPase DnaA